MFEKEKVMIHRWNEVLGYDECSDELLSSLEGKPVVINVAGVKQKLGIVKKVTRGRDGILVDLVLGTTEKLALTRKPDGRVIFKEVYIDYPNAVKIEKPKEEPETEPEEPVPESEPEVESEIKPEVEKEVIGGDDEEINES